MANRRMFSLSVVDTDTFIEMPITSRLLYYELGMRADDDGFVDNWKKIMKFAGLSEDDMKILIAKKFIIPFDSGVIVIRHWRLNNYLRNDRYTPTLYKNELAQLQISDNIYELENTEKSTMLPVGIPAGIPVVSTGKDRIGKDRIGNSCCEKDEVNKKDEVMLFYLNNINSTPVIKEVEIIESYEKEMSPELMIYGMEKAVEKKARNLAYIKGVWNSWLNKGITTLAEAKEETKGNKSNNVIDWSGFMERHKEDG